MDNPRTVIGDNLGVPFPTTIESLRERGVDFLTAAFRASGILAADNRVTAITEFTEFFGGGMGRKLLLSVNYQRLESGLEEDLFVKFPRDFGDPLREFFGPLMESEVRFALLSRDKAFPIRVPKCYFADFNGASVSGIQITERIRYGQGPIERCHDKCLDYEMPDPLAHYRALTVAMARLAGFHKAGRFGPAIEERFPFDPNAIDVGSRIPYTPAQLQGKLDKLLSFAETYPGLLPAELASMHFLRRFAVEAPLVLEHEVAIRSHLNKQADYVALCHWNCNVDNAWFWTDDQNELQAGLLDWGSVGQMNVAQAFYGMTCSAEPAFLRRHSRELLQLFVAEYERNGGPAIRLEQLLLSYKLSVAVLGIAWILDAPSLVESQIPDLKCVPDRHDPRLKGNFLARAQLQLLVVLLDTWLFEDIGEAMRTFVQEAQTA